ncbi:MAG TPA: hypothetical protein PL187_22585, partial [Caldilinea sp.]|nr:hypothetical protein [Caldilinea sp.]
MSTAVHHAIHQLFAGSHLTIDEADAAMAQIMEGEATPAQIGAFLAALRMKGETVDEITGCARAMKRSAVQVRPAIGDAMLVDVVGTVQGLMSGPVGKALGAVEAKVGMKAMHESLLAGAASKPFVGKWMQRYLGQLIGPTWRYSLSEFSRTNALGDRPHLGDQALDGAVTFATMPIFAGASWAAEKLQRTISGEASALTAAFK